MQIVRNSRADRNVPYKGEQLAVVSLEQSKKAAQFMRGCPLHAETPLHSFELLAKRLGVGHVFVKDETAQLGLSSFKALGGAYAVMLRSPNSPLRDSPAVGRPDRVATFATATDGNHGISVAAGLGGLMQLASSIEARERIGLTDRSVILCVCSERLPDRAALESLTSTRRQTLRV